MLTKRVSELLKYIAVEPRKTNRRNDSMYKLRNPLIFFRRIYTRTREKYVPIVV
jgi:hypothetical protein